MQKVNVYAFYNFGKRLVESVSISMRTIMEPHTMSGDYPEVDATTMLGSLEAVYANCLIFLEKTETCKLPKSRQKVREIEELELKYWNLIGNALHIHDDAARHELYTRWLRRTSELVAEFDETLRHEIDRINAFVTTDKGSHDIEILAERAHEGFEADVRKYLPDTAIYDFKEAGKCYLFDLYTAMGYHILRGVEAVALKYLETAKGAPYTGDPGLGQYIGALRAKVLNVPPRIIQRLDELREFERNPIAHPEFIVGADDALSMYNCSQGIVPLMTKEISKIEAAKTPVT